MTMLDDRRVDDLDRPSPWSNATMSSAAEMGRWRLAARLARREIRRRPWRTLLVVLLIGVPVAGMVVGDAAYRSGQLPPDQSHRLGTADARVTVWGFEGDDEAASALLPDDLTAQWGVEAGFLPLRSAAAPDMVVNVDLSTIDMASPLAAGIARPTQGRLPTADDEVFLADRVARQFGVQVGDTLQLVRPAQTFQVVGTGTAGGYPALMAAPGFDVAVLRPDSVQRTALVDGESASGGTLDSVTFGTAEQEASLSVEFPEVPATDYVALFLGWVFAIMLMAVLGIVVSAAFAVSGRRQLVTIGQLSASGTDPAVLRRYLALQGTWSGAVGVVVGLVTGLAIVPQLRSVVANDGRTEIGSIDLLVIAVIALATATIAAIVPTRDLARTSVLAALGGRRPVAKVRPRQVRIGALLVAGGLTALWLAVTSARNANDTGDGLGAAVVLAGAGGLAVLAGMCCVCPVVVDLVARLGSRRGGAVRLATRGLGRHRARSAALVAAVAAIGAAAMAAGATAEQEFADRQEWQSMMALDRITVTTYSLAPSEDVKGLPVDTTPPVAQSALDEIDAVVGPVSWYRAEQVLPDGGARLTTPMLVADEGLIDLIGLTSDQRAALSAADAAYIVPLDPAWSTSDELVRTMFGDLDAISMRADVDGLREWSVITPAAVQRLGLDTVPAEVFGTLDHDITRDEYDEVVSLTSVTNESAYFTDIPLGETGTNVSVGFPESDYTALTRLIILGGMLLLTTVVVGVGMALWAAEGRDERDALVSIGAAPGVLARVVGLKAWLLAFAGGVIAVPLGYGTLRLAVAAAHQETTFPWLVAGGVVMVVPVLIGTVATVGSAIVQRARPVRMSTLATD